MAFGLSEAFGVRQRETIVKRTFTHYPRLAVLQHLRHQAALECERTFSEGDSPSQNFRKLFQAVFSNQPFAFFEKINVRSKCHDLSKHSVKTFTHVFGKKADYPNTIMLKQCIFVSSLAVE